MFVLVYNMSDTAFNSKLWQLGRQVWEHQFLCPGRVINLAHFALQANPIEGAVAEFGCHEGRTGAFLSWLMKRPIHLYDSFLGLPEPTIKDGKPIFQAGSMRTNPKTVFDTFKRVDVQTPIIRTGWFKDINPEEVPPLAFAHLDGDFYESIADSLRLVYPKLVPRGTVVIDDYGWSNLCGVKAACDDFFDCKPEKVTPLVTFNPEGFQAYFQKGA